MVGIVGFVLVLTTGACFTAVSGGAPPIAPPRAGENAASTFTPIPTVTPTVLPTATIYWLNMRVAVTAVVLHIASPPPLPTSMPVVLNGIPLDNLIIMPPGVAENARQIFAHGQSLGNNPRAFSKLGDSTIENPHFLTRFDSGPYNLGEFIYLQPIVDTFRGSFGRQGAAVRRGLHAWSVMDSMWADKSVCQAAETMLACEFRLHNPSFLFVRLGSNDTGVPESFERGLREVVAFSMAEGVVPLLGTKADRHEGSNINNEIIRRVAAEYQVPLWDFDILAGTLPGRGLDLDYVHLKSFFAHDYTSPVAFQRGHGMHNLLALLMLDRVLRVVMTPV